MANKATLVVGVDGSPKTVVEWPGDSGGDSFNPNRVDCSVNSGRVDGLYTAQPVLHTQPAGNVVGGFNGGGTGNKSICGYRLIPDGQPLSAWQGFSYTWRDLDPLNPGLPTYANILVDVNGDGSLIKIFVVDPVSLPALNNGTNTPNVDGSTTTSYAAASQFVLIVNLLAGVAPAVSLGPAWPANSFRISDVLAVYPNARFLETASGDGGLPKSPNVTPAFLLVTGDSLNQQIRAMRVSGVTFNGASL
jgi:hypothetical protein